MNGRRLIDANALLERMNVVTADDTCPLYIAAEIDQEIELAPTVDAVEVVRCKDCIHYKPQNQGAHRNCTAPYCMRVVAVKVKPDDFCFYGERRTDGTHPL